ncbi:MAG: DUF3667 domain-containing protein [Gemmatimonadota bacterium]
MVTACLNCGAAVTGRFCGACGQEARDPDPPIRHLAREMFAEALGADSRTWRTLRLLLLKPGALTSEYFVGRRGRYLDPLRLYLLLSAAFLAIALFTPAGESMIQVQAPDDVAMGAERFRETFLNIWPWYLVGLLPAFAAVYAVLLWGTRASFTRHLLFTLHLHAFGFAAMALAGLLGFVPPAALGGSLGMLTLVALPVYLVLALRRAYGISWGAALAVAGAAIFVNALVAAGSTYLAYMTVVWMG